MQEWFRKDFFFFSRSLFFFKGRGRGKIILVWFRDGVVSKDPIPITNQVNEYESFRFILFHLKISVAVWLILSFQYLMAGSALSLLPMSAFHSASVFNQGTAKPLSLSIISWGISCSGWIMEHFKAKFLDSGR